MIGGRENNMMTLEEEADIKNRMTQIEKDLQSLVKNFIITQNHLHIVK